MKTATATKSRKSTVKKTEKKTAPAPVVTTAPAPVVITVDPVNITTKAITNIAMLCKVRVSTWVGNIRDNDLTSTACRDNKIDATQRLLSVRKRLMKSDALNDVINTAQKIRKHHDSVTRPWLPGGIGCFPSVTFTEVKEVFDSLKVEFYSKKDKFISSVDDIVKADREKLGAAFDITDYPSAAELAEKFDVEIEYMPIPSVNDFRVEGLSTETLTQLQEEMQSNLEKRMREGDAALLQRIMTGDQPSSNDGRGNGLQQLLYRLTTPNDKGEVRFKQNSLDNIKDFAKQVAKLNIGGNKELADICSELETVFTCDAETLRENEDKRNDKVAQTKAAISKIEEAMEGLI